MKKILMMTCFLICVSLLTASTTLPRGHKAEKQNNHKSRTKTKSREQQKIGRNEKFQKIAIKTLIKNNHNHGNNRNKYRQSSQYVGLTAQSNALKEIMSKQSDIAIIDSIMGNYIIANNPSYKAKLALVPNIDMPREEYGIAFRKESVLTKKVNFVMSELIADGTIERIATKYGLQDETIDIEIAIEPTYTETENVEWAEYVADGVKIGYTKFAPIAFDGDDGKLTGYDIDLANAVFAKLGIDKIEYVQITWAQKITELKSGQIDAIWNGMTITEELSSQLAISEPYLKNSQVAVVRKEDLATFATKKSWKEAKIAVEKGSAGERFVKELLDIK